MKPTPNEFPNLALIRQGVDYRFKVKLRAKELEMRPLSVSEEDQITQEVVTEMARLPEIQRTSLRQSLLLSIKKLEKAQTSAPGEYDPEIFAAELNQLTPGEIEFIFKEWNAGNDKLNPILDKMPVKDVELWVEGLKKNSSDREMTLIGLSFFQLVNICHHLLAQEELQADKLPG